MKTIFLAAVLAAGLSACALETVVVGLGIGVSAYCAGISQAGKEVVRDTLTAGQKVIACEEAE